MRLAGSSVAGLCTSQAYADASSNRNHIQCLKALHHRSEGLLLTQPAAASAPCRMHTLTAEMIMATGVYGFREIENVGRLMDVLRVTTHNGFPVFGDDK